MSDALRRAKESAVMGNDLRLRTSAEEGERDERTPDEERRDACDRVFARFAERLAIGLDELHELGSATQSPMLAVPHCPAVANRVEHTRFAALAHEQVGPTDAQGPRRVEVR